MPRGGKRPGAGRPKGSRGRTLGAVAPKESDSSKAPAVERELSRPAAQPQGSRSAPDIAPTVSGITLIPSDVPSLLAEHQRRLAETQRDLEAVRRMPDALPRDIAMLRASEDRI